MNKQKRIEIFTRLREANPNPTTELNYSSPFELLIAVILSAQATDVGVNKATDKLFPVANTPEAIFALGVDGLKEYIKTIGLFNSKAKNVIAAARILVDDYGGEVPSSRAALSSLPGVGRKTANVVLGNAFGVPGITVDTHMGRLARRLGLTVNEDPVVVERDLMALIERPEWTLWSHRVIFHGRRRCKARKPECGTCEIAALCPSAPGAKVRSAAS